jgi:hypothetical protein
MYDWNIVLEWFDVSHTGQIHRTEYWNIPVFFVHGWTCVKFNTSNMSPFVTYNCIRIPCTFLGTNRARTIGIIQGFVVGQDWVQLDYLAKFWWANGCVYLNSVPKIDLCLKLDTSCVDVSNISALERFNEAFCCRLISLMLSIIQH